METFFFHLIYDNYTVGDPEGSRLVDLDAASAEAYQIIRELAADRLMSGKPFLLRSVHVCDYEACMLANISTAKAISAVIAPDIFKLGTDYFAIVKEG